MSKKERTGIIKALIGNPKKDFSLKFIPGLIDDAKKQESDQDNKVDASKIDKSEVIVRYKNMQRAYYAVAILFLFCIFQAFLIDLWVNKAGSLLAAVLMAVFLLKFGLKLWLIRMLNTPSRVILPEKIRLSDYLLYCLSSPKDLLPLPLRSNKP